jgi:hypothetical protein
VIAITNDGLQVGQIQFSNSLYSTITGDAIFKKYFLIQRENVKYRPKKKTHSVFDETLEHKFTLPLDYFINGDIIYINGKKYRDRIPVEVKVLQKSINEFIFESIADMRPFTGYAGIGELVEDDDDDYEESLKPENNI